MSARPDTLPPIRITRHGYALTRIAAADGGFVLWRCWRCLAVRLVAWESLSLHAPACPCAVQRAEAERVRRVRDWRVSA